MNDAVRRRSLLLVAGVLLAWGLVVLVTGGVIIETPWRPITSRAAIRPLVAGGFLLLFYTVRWRRHWRADVGPLIHLSPALIVAAPFIVGTLVIGLRWSTRIAGGPDASGYVSQAAMFVRGELTMPAPEWARDAPWNDAALTASPVGYRPTRQTHILAPIYSPGYPLLMALFQVIAGPGAVFHVIPFLGALTVWATWRLGRELGGSWTGAAAAALVTTSAAFLIMLVQPMSDVAAAAFWTLALLAAVRGRPVVSGCATAIAILVRPNVIPLAIVPVLLLALDEPRPPKSSLCARKRRIARITLFVTAVIPAAATIGLLNWYYYGSPLQSGYGPLGDIYSASRIGTNLQRYGSWFFATQTPLPLVGLLAPAFGRHGRDRPHVLLVTTVFPVLLLALYLPYLVFYPQEWAYLRFLLPAYPALMIGFAMVVARMSRWVPNTVLATLAATLIVAVVCVYSWEFARANSLFAFKAADQRYARAVEYVKRLPARSVILSLAHSGPLRFYTGRDVIRFEALATEDLDTAVFHLRDRGYAVYFVGDDFEVDMFRERAAGTRTAALLDSAPRVDLRGSVVYTLSTPADEARPN